MSASKDSRALALLESGIAEFESGRIEQARLLCEQALQLAPRQPDALHLRGVIALQAGDYAAAIDQLARAVSLRPDIAAYHGNLAHGYVGLKRLPEALAAFERAASLEPGNPELELGVGSCLGLLGQPAEAEDVFRRIVERHPQHALAWFNLARAVDEQQRYEDAYELYQHVTRLAPQVADGHNNLGNTLSQLGRYEEAEAAYRACLARNPGYLAAQVNLAIVLNYLRRHDEAEKLCRSVLARDPGQKNAIPILARALSFQHRWQEAVQWYERAVAEFPDNSEAFGALGNALARIGNLPEALNAFDRAAGAGNVSVHTHFAKAVALFSFGRMAEGAAVFADRHERAAFVENHPERPLATALPLDLQGQSVCLHGEQGLGDELFFLRFAPQLKARGARVIYHANPKLVPLLSRSSALDLVLPNVEPYAPADHVLFVGDLLVHFLRNTEASPFRPQSRRRHGAVPTLGASLARHSRVYWPELPRPLPLSPLPERLATVRERLSRLGPPPYIGVTWRAGTGPEGQRGHVWSLFKAAPLEAIAGALRNIEGTLISVQRAPRTGETEHLAALSGQPVHDLSASNEDLEEMLALMAVLDEYIGVSNTNTHLRAGAGRQSRVLLPWPAEWRWMVSGEESHWFPGFRLYRQQADGNWENAISRLARDLSGRAG